MLNNALHRPGPTLAIAGEFTLAQGRAHEACGPSRHILALATASATHGPVLWVAPAWTTERLCGDGIARWIDPARLVLIHPSRTANLLWCTEEALRSGALSLVVTELPEPPGLTPVRRLHLACEASRTGKSAATSLLLTPGEGGAAGVESRWHATPHHSRHLSQWQLSRHRARTATPATWLLTHPAPRTRPTLLPLPTQHAA